MVDLALKMYLPIIQPSLETCRKKNGPFTFKYAYIMTGFQPLNYKPK
jgi:hypothetical protein